MSTLSESEEYLEKIKQSILDDLPQWAEVEEIQFEGPEIAIYSNNPKFVGDNREIIKEIVKKIRKRIVVRTTSQIRKDNNECVEIIQKIVPEDAQITKIFFNENLGEVIIEATKPGVAIGKNGINLTEIKKQTLWLPRVIRTPPIQSKTVDLVRNMLQKERTLQKQIFRKIGKRIHRPQIQKNVEIKLTALGGYREVGRSCTLITTNESSVLLDCGMNVGNPGDLFPYLETGELNLDELDAVILTHAHLDHSGLIPFLFKWGYDGPVYMTEPTMHLSTMLQLDYINICKREGKNAPYSKVDVKNAVLHTYCLEWGKVTDIAPDIKLTLHNAGHILGSSLVHLHFGSGDHNLVYTGDFKFQKTRLLEAASCKFPRLETLITESTYGGVNDIIPSRQQSEQRLIQVVNQTIKRGGKILFPMLAVGRAQEVMVILEDFISRQMIEPVPVYVDGMISEATAIHTTHPDYLNSTLREKIFHQGKNPFTSSIFTQVEGYQARDDIINGGPCIIMATSGMLQGGPSLQYLKALAEDERNTLIFCSYQVEGTLGRRIQKGYKQFDFQTSVGKSQPVKINLQVETIEGFSGHSSRSQIMSFIRKLKPRPKRILTVHGEPSKTMSLASVIHQRLKSETRSLMNREAIILD